MDRTFWEKLTILHKMANFPKAVNMYTQALTLLDQYDHQSIVKPEGASPIYHITYEDCRKMVDHMEATFKSDVFGVEKEKTKDIIQKNGSDTIITKGGYMIRIHVA